MNVFISLNIIRIIAIAAYMDVDLAYYEILL